MKKFEPWIQKADAKRAVGMLKPKNLAEALDQLEGANVSFQVNFRLFKKATKMSNQLGDFVKLLWPS